MKTPLCSDGKEIHVGTALRHVSDGTRGVVVRIVKPGDKGIPGLDCIGDLNIATSPGSTRVTNRYTEWRRIPEEEQTYAERFACWYHSGSSYDPEWCRGSQTEHDAIRGILALLPPGAVDYDNPSTVSEALHHMAKHLDTLRNDELAKLVRKLREALK